MAFGAAAGAAGALGLLTALASTLARKWRRRTTWRSLSTADEVEGMVADSAHIDAGNHDDDDNSTSEEMFHVPVAAATLRTGTTVDPDDECEL